MSAAAESVSKLGGKARGLRRLPPGWTPPFVVVQGNARRWRSATPERGAAAEATSIDGLLREAQARNQRLLVRSDSTSELSEIGRRRTRVVPPDRHAVAGAISRAMKEIGASGRPIVQIAVEPTILGLASNERRLTRNPARFLAEGFIPGRPQRWLSVVSAAERGSALTASSIDEAIIALRGAFGALSPDDRRIRIEWAWDGKQVWILQADEVFDVPRSRSAGGYLGLRPRFDQRQEALPTRLTNFPGTKVERTRLLERLGLPAPPLLASTDFAAPTPVDQLNLAVQKVAGRTFVVRTDMRRGDQRESLLLPTSPPALTFADVATWAEATATLMRDRGLADRDWTFLISELIPARASAWATAGPGSTEVVVDALWGFPDGLLHLAHDTFTLRDRRVIAREIRYKPACLLADPGGWQYASVPEPFDWRPVLSPAELTQIADWVVALADFVARPVQLMVLARVGPGKRAMYAFYFTTMTPERPMTHPMRTGAVIAITTEDDLAGLGDGSTRPSAEAIRLEVAAPLLRNPAFLLRAGLSAATANLPIVFSGSPLGHAFHLLNSTGAAVVASSTDRQPAVEQMFPVIVRRQFGLARLQHLTDVVWSSILDAIASQSASQPTADSVAREKDAASVVSYFRHKKARVHARQAAGIGQFYRLPEVEELSGARLPIPADAPGVVPLFMDEARQPGSGSGAPRLRVTLPRLDKESGATRELGKPEQVTFTIDAPCVSP